MPDPTQCHQLEFDAYTDQLRCMQANDTDIKNTFGPTSKVYRTYQGLKEIVEDALFDGDFGC